MGLGGLIDIVQRSACDPPSLDPRPYCRHDLIALASTRCDQTQNFLGHVLAFVLAEAEVEIRDHHLSIDALHQLEHFWIINSHATHPSTKYFRSDQSLAK